MGVDADYTEFLSGCYKQLSAFGVAGLLYFQRKHI